MPTQIIEGSYTDVQLRLDAMHLKPETHLRVVVTEPDRSEQPEKIEFDKSRGRNGLIVLPFPDLNTLEQVKEALDRADLEDGIFE